MPPLISLRLVMALVRSLASSPSTSGTALAQKTICIWQIIMGWNLIRLA